MNLTQKIVPYSALLVLLLSSDVSSQDVVKVSQPAWLSLSPNEREVVQKDHIVEIVDQDFFGIIIDNQGVNESTTGTTGGATLGSAYANAAYVDHSIKSGNYSARNQLAVGLLGALVGSTLDTSPKAQFHYRYAVKLGSGNINYFDETKSDPFRHPVGACVSVPNIALTDQQLCTQTAESLRSALLNPNVTQVPEPSSPTVSTIELNTSAKVSHPEVDSPSTQINCKLGTLAPVRTSAEKCKLINGSIVQ